MRTKVLLAIHRIVFVLASMALLYDLAVADESIRYSRDSAKQFMHQWVVLGPLHQKEAGDATQASESLAVDYLAEAGGESQVTPDAKASVEIDGASYQWKTIDADNDIIDLSKSLGEREYHVAYAYAEIESDVAQQVVFGLGSDDSARVWLNGELIHEAVTGRAVQADQDLIAAKLVEGQNRLLLKIQNHLGEWGFTCRILDQSKLDSRLAAAAATRDVRLVDRLLDLGASVDARGNLNLTALQAAKVTGHTEMVEHLLAKGADDQIEMPAWQVAIQERIAELTKEDSAAIALLIDQNGEVFKAVGGFASLSHQVRATPGTKFRIGSVSKQFTAAAILKLQEEDKLKVEDTLDKYFPDFPRGGEVTLHQLLTHTSGIHSYTDKPDFSSNVAASIEPEQLIASFQNDPYDFAPGKGWHYDNSGYFLLGRIIEKVSGQSYADYLRLTFFEPLDMKDSGVHHWQAILNHEATGYAWADGQWQQALNWDMSHAGGAGAIYSTVEDLQRWNAAVFGGQVLSDESLKAAFTPIALPEGVSGLPYGYGWIIGEQRGLKTIGHGGGLAGFSSYLVRFPDQKLTIVALVNALPSSPGLNPTEVANEAAQLILWQEMKPITRPTVDTNVTAEMLTAYVGRYDYQGAAILTVVQDGNRLFAQLTGQPQWEIFPKSETEFFWKVVDAQITFVKTEAGEVTHAVHRQSGVEFKAPKLKPQPTAKVSAEQLEKYVGRYDYGARVAVLTVTHDGEHLFAQMTGQPKFEIFPKSETEFYWKVVAAEVKFVADDDGNVSKVVHSQAGQTIEAPRID